MASSLPMECVVEKVWNLNVLLRLEAKVWGQFFLSLLGDGLLQVDSILNVPHVLGHALVASERAPLLQASIPKSQFIAIVLLGILPSLELYV